MSTRVAVCQPSRPTGYSLPRLLRSHGHAIEAIGRPPQIASLVGRKPLDAVFANGCGSDDLGELGAVCQHSDTGLIAICVPDDVDAVQALRLGADDYLAVPANPDEVLARLEAVVRRTRRAAADVTAGDDVVATDAFVIDVHNRTIRGRDGTEPRLTGTEWRLVTRLVRQPGRIVPADELLADVWGPRAAGKTHYLRIHIASVRRKLEPEPSRPRYFLTEPTVGLRFRPQVPDSRTA